MNIRRWWPWFVSMLLHGLFIFGALNHRPPLLREEKVITIALAPEKDIDGKNMRDFQEIDEPEPGSSSYKKGVFEPALKSRAGSLPKNEAVSRNGLFFLLDASESMVIGLEAARQILISKLHNLSETMPLNIVYFSNEVVFFSPEPFFMTGDLKEKALTFCQEISPQGYLDMVEGLKEVSRRNPSRIILISDGLVEDRESMLRFIRNSKKEGIIIDTVLIKRTPFEEEILKRAAYLTGGSFSIFPQTF